MRQRSLGSGFVVDAQGYILTNRHVIDGATEISVSFPEGKRYEAKVIGQDARTDVALIKIEPEEALTVLPLGDSDTAQPGEWVMAIGNPFRLGNSVSVGVVSFHGRDVPLQRGTSIDMIQTDAAINPGNSGGPLLNTRGEVIGINTMIVTDGGSRVNAGVGFSVPINVAKEILPQLREKGKVIRGWMGVRIGAVTEDLAETYGLDEARGAIVSSVDSGSAGGRRGSRAGGRHPGRRRQRDRGQRRPLPLHRLPGPGNQGGAGGAARQAAPHDLGHPRHVPGRHGGQVAREDTDRPRLGMSVRDVTPALAERLGLPPGTRGVLITDVETGEPAEEAGLQPNSSSCR